MCRPLAIGRSSCSSPHCAICCVVHCVVHCVIPGKWAEFPEFTASVYPPWPNGAVHVVSRPIAQYIADNRERLFNAQGEDVAIGIWLDRSPFKVCDHQSLFYFYHPSNRTRVA